MSEENEKPPKRDAKNILGQIIKTAKGRLLDGYNLLMSQIGGV